MIVILAISLFVVIVLAGSSLAALVRTKDESDKNLQQRIELAAGAPTRPAAPVLKDQRRSTIRPLDAALSRVPFVPAIDRMIRQAGMQRRSGELLLYMALLAVSALLVGTLIGLSTPMAVVVALVAGAIPLWLVQRRRSIRARRFAEQLPDALDLIRAALQAGHGFATALMVVASEFPDPIAEEFREVGEETRLGLSLREALTNLNQRIDDPDLPMLIIGVLITEDSGGNLAEVLDNIGHTVRERFKMSRDVATMTAQGRLSGYVLSALPLIVGLASYFLNPKFFAPMVSNPLGQLMLAYAGLSVLFGHIVIQRIARLDV